MVAKAGKEEECIEICRKWDLDVAVVGKVTADGILRVLDQGKVVAEIPAKALADDGPRYERPYQPPAYQDMLTNVNYDVIPDVKDANAALLALLESPTKLPFVKAPPSSFLPTWLRVSSPVPSSWICQGRKWLKEWVASAGEDDGSFMVRGSVRSSGR